LTARGYAAFFEWFIVLACFLVLDGSDYGFASDDFAEDDVFVV
jgi:hypothetical protein